MTRMHPSYPLVHGDALKTAQALRVASSCRVEPRDDRPLPRDDLDEPFRLQMPQHFAHDGTAHAQFIAQRAFDEPGARPETALHDCAAQLVKREFAQRLRVAVDFEGLTRQQ